MDAFLSRTPELRDADQRAFLYSDLSQQKTDNPEGYQEALDFWSKFLLRACKQGLLSPGAGRNTRAKNKADTQHLSSDDEQDDSDGDDEVDVLDKINKDSEKLSQPTAAKDPVSVLCIDKQSLETRLTFKGDTPTGLDAIVDEMVQRGLLQPIDTFFSTTMRKWLGWMVSQIPLVPRQLTTFIASGSNHSKSLLVAVSLVNAAAERILSEHYGSIGYPLTDNLMSVQEFRERFAGALSPKLQTMVAIDADILIKHLANSRHVITAPLDSSSARTSADGSQTLIKFATSRGQTISEAQQPISEADIGAYQVMHTRREIEKQVHMLEARANELDGQIRGALQRKQKSLALAKLRLKKHLENDILAKRLGALETIEKVALQLQQTSSDIQLMQALAVGTRTLRGLNQQVDVDSANRTFDDWAEEALRASEMESVMSDGAALVQSGLPESVVGEDVDKELEAELDALLAADDSSKASAAKAGSEAADALAEALAKVDISKPETVAAAAAAAAAAEPDSEEQEESGESASSEQVAIPA